MMPEPQQQTSGQSNTELTVESSLLDRIVQEGKLGQSEEERKQGKEWVDAFLQEVMRDQMLVSKDTEANIAASAHAPFISAASAELFNLADFTELGGPRDLAKTFDNELYTRWKSFRESDDSMYVGLAMPHVLMRPPYGKDSITIESFNYE